jgi:two-component system sensor histidine kinase VicK
MLLYRSGDHWSPNKGVKMIKSLQTKMILVMFILILLIIVFSAFFSIMKMEQVYYRGFAEEMLNTIAGFGINIDANRNNPPDSNVGPKAPVDDIGDLQKFILNFNIYFSINNNTRNGTILDKDFNVVFSSKKENINTEIVSQMEALSNLQEPYHLINDVKTNEYYFIYFLRNSEDGSITNSILIEQDKTYINSQLKEVTIMYIVGVVIISIITMIVTTLLASNVTKPIEFIRKKAQLIAAGDEIDEIVLDDSQKSEYEVIRLVDAFNLMIREIRNNLSEISNEKNKLEAILLHLSDGVLAFNTSGELILSNPAGKKLLNVEDEVLFEDIFKKADADINMEKIMYLDDWTTTEQQIKLGDMYINVVFAAFRNEQDNLGGLVAVAHDTTKQVKLDEMRKEFVANVSHELKTPLTSIKTYTETILDDEMDLEDEETKRFLNVILSESNRMSRLVSDLLQLTKFDYKKVSWNKLFFDICELTKQVCEKHEIQAETKKQTLDCYITSNVPMVFADRDGIEQVITNILTNSIKYTPEEGSIKVYVGCVHDDAYIKIIDNGIGIPEEDVKRVFERFYRVDKARSREMGGTGLGLAIVKNAILLHGGTIEAKNEPQGGLSLNFHIPRCRM